MGARASLHDDGAYRVEALAKGLRILALFSVQRPALRLKEIATLTGLPLPTVFRLVATLAEESFLERMPDGYVRPGTAVLTLGFAALHGADIVANSELVLRELAAATKQTVNLGVLSRDEVLYVARIYSHSLIGANVTIGSRLPAVATSMGKLLLAFSSEADVAERIGSASFEGPRGPNALRSFDALRAALVPVRSAGYAVQDEEVAHGLRSIAGPIRQSDGKVIAAVNVAVPAAAFSVEHMIAAFRDPLLAACDHISRRLGAQR